MILYLDAIIAVGYRVNSKEATSFRIWVTNTLKEYIKNNPNSERLFKELLDISEECKDLISLMYYSYIADETEKEEIGKIWRQNEELYQNKLKEKFYYDNMLKNNLENKLVDNKALPTIISKPSLIQRIVKALKSFLRINK